MNTGSIVRILFIGNSFTQRNDLPRLVASLAGERGLTVEHRLISAGGASLRMHWNKGEAAEAIRAGGWDIVVLQEQSTLPVKNAARMLENILLFDGVVRASVARAALYCTWARKASPQTQDAITEAYASAAERTGATLVPVGPAWQRFAGRHSEPDLYDADGSHPSLAGSYLAACVFLKALLGLSPVGLTVVPRGLSPRDAAKLQQAA